MSETSTPSQASDVPPNSQFQPEPSPVWTPPADAQQPAQVAVWQPPAPPIMSMPAPVATRSQQWPPAAQPALTLPPRRAISDLVSALDREPTIQATGWRKLLHMGPSQAAVSQFADEKWLRAQFPRPIVIAVADPKGGAGKTPTTVGLAAAFGLARGSGVIAWDNNELRGTLADRTFSAHRNTVVDMLIRAESLLRPDTRVADVQAMLNYQSTGQFWVLGSSQEAGQAISGEQFATVREILSRFFSVIIIDTGNNEVAPNWVETVINADVLVVPVKWRKDNIVPAARMIETLTEQSRDIINRIVVVGTNGPGELMPTIQTSVADWFKPSPIIEIPTDPHIAEGAEIDWNQLQPATRRAYQSLGATVAKTVSAYLRGGQ